MYVLTKDGEKAVMEFLKECKKERERLLSEGLDTADETTLPTMEDILADLNNGVSICPMDKGGAYFNGWGITDNHNSKDMLWLEPGSDFFDPDSRTKIGVTFEKTIRVYKTFDATVEEMQQIENGENPFFERMEAICDEEHGDVEYDYAIEDKDNGKTLVPWD